MHQFQGRGGLPTRVPVGGAAIAPDLQGIFRFLPNGRPTTPR